MIIDSNESLAAMAFLIAIAAIVMLAVVLQRLGEVNRQLSDLRHRLSKDAPNAAISAKPPSSAAASEQRTAPQPPSPAVVAIDAPKTLPPTPPEQKAARSLPLPRAPEPAAAPTPALSDHLTEARLGQRGLLVVGIVILVVGIGYFLQYSFQQGWVSPAMRVFMTYLSGGALLALGELFRRRAYASFGLTLAGGGVATLYFATFAGYGLYSLLPAIPAFSLMVVVTILAGTLAVFYNNRWLAVLGIVGGFATPLLIQVETPATVPFFLYLVILNTGILGIAYYRAWGLLHYLGAVATWLVFFSWLIGPSSRADFWYELAFANFTFLVYALAPLLYSLRTGQKNTAGAWSLIVPNTLLALGVSLEMISVKFSQQAGGALTVAYGLFFVALASWIQRHRPASKGAFSAALVKAILFTGLTIPLLFSGPWITAFWAIAAIAVGWAGVRLGNRWVFAGSLIMGAVALFHLHTWAYPHVFRFHGFARGFRDGWTDQATVRLFLGALTVAMLVLFSRFARLLPTPRPMLAMIAMGFAALQLFFVLNLEIRGFFLTNAPGAADAATSILWALFSIGLIAIGFRQRLREVRFVGVGLFAITLGKVVLVDMAQAATPFRILSSVILGLLMIVASFLYHRFKDVVEEGGEAPVSDQTPDPSPPSP
jgi:uncharacterized membrane protein